MSADDQRTLLVAAVAALYVAFSSSQFTRRRHLLKQKVLFARGSMAGLLQFRQALTLHTSTVEPRLVGSCLLWGLAVLCIILAAIGCRSSEISPLEMATLLAVSMAFVAAGVDVGPWMRRLIITEGGIIDHGNPIPWRNVIRVEMEKSDLSNGCFPVIHHKELGLPNRIFFFNYDLISPSDYGEIMAICTHQKKLTAERKDPTHDT